MEADSSGWRSQSGKRFTCIENPRVPREARTEHAHRLLRKAVARIERRSHDLRPKKYDRHHSGCKQTEACNAAMAMRFARLR